MAERDEGLRDREEEVSYSEPLQTKVEATMRDRVKRVARGLGLDVASFLRHLLTEHLDCYEARIAARKRSDPSSPC